MKKLVFGIFLSAIGFLLMLLRRPLLAHLVGKTKLKLGLFLGIDRAHQALFILLLAGIILVMIGIALIIWFVRTPPQVE